MENAELIKQARAEANCKQRKGCGGCPMPRYKDAQGAKMCAGFIEKVLPQLCDALEAADKAQRWIPCAERLPEAEKKVLIRMSGKTFGHAYTTIAAHIGYHDAKAEDDWQEYEGETEYDEENDCFWVHPCWYEVNMVDDNPNYELDDDYEVTHWQPLPQPPQKG